MPPDAAPVGPMPAEPKLHEVIYAIAAQLDPDRLGIGPLAMLRRLDPAGSLAEPALQRLLCQYVPDAWLGSEDGMRRWALLVHAMALAAPDLHRTYGINGRLGLALFEAGYSEGRLVRLLEARAADLPVAIPRAVRFLVAKRQGFDSVMLARWVLGIAAGDGGAERQRTLVARDYFRAERKAGQAA
jgi:CRISPR system Cascade subunit CasB